MVDIFNKVFKIKNLDDLTYFLGLGVARNKTSIHICQQKYNLDLLKDSKMMSCAPVTTPMNLSIKVYAIGDYLLLDHSSYRRILEGLCILSTQSSILLKLFITLVSLSLFLPSSIIKIY